MNKTILLDIDLTVCSSDKKWYHWLCKVTGESLYTKPWNMHRSPYDLTVFFKEALSEEGMTGYEFWNQDNLYDQHMDLVEGSVEALERISNLGYTIIPVSKEKGLHGYSKRQWVKRNLPMCEPCILVDGDAPEATKSAVKGDYFIEDRAIEFKDFTSPTKGVIFNTSYLDVDNIWKIKIPYVVMDNWNQIADYFEEELRC